MRGSDPRRVLYFFLVGIAVSGISRAAIADSFQDSENSTLTQADTESSGEPVSKPDDTPKPVESLGKIAVGWFGTLPRVHAHTAHPDLKQLVMEVFPFFRRQVVAPNVRAGAAVHLFGHTFADAAPEPGYKSQHLLQAIRSHFDSADLEEVHVTTSPKQPHYGNYNAGMFHSLGKVVKMVESSNVTYSMVLLLQWDTVFFTPFEAAALSPELLYVASWCSAIGGSSKPGDADKKKRALEAQGANTSEGVRDGIGGRPADQEGSEISQDLTPEDVTCRELAYTPPCDSTKSIPELYFAGQLATLKEVFEDLVRELDYGLFKHDADNCPKGHGVVESRLEYLQSRGAMINRLARYKVLGLDARLVRDGKHPDTWDVAAGCARKLIEAGVGLWDGGDPSSLVNLSQPQETSVCPAVSSWCWCNLPRPVVQAQPQPPKVQPPKKEKHVKDKAGSAKDAADAALAKQINQELKKYTRKLGGGDARIGAAALNHARIKVGSAAHMESVVSEMRAQSRNARAAKQLHEDIKRLDHKSGSKSSKSPGKG